MQLSAERDWVEALALFRSLQRIEYYSESFGILQAVQQEYLVISWFEHCPTLQSVQFAYKERDLPAEYDCSQLKALPQRIVYQR